MTMNRWALVLLTAAAAVAIGPHLRAAEDASAGSDAASEWSPPVAGLSGRLLVSLEDLKTCWRHAITVELKNVSSEPLAVINQPRITGVKLLDAEGRPLADVGYDQSGRIPLPQWAVIPRDAYAGFRVDMTTVGVPGGERVALLALGNKVWFLGPGTYSLQADLVAARGEGPANQWVGTLELPAVAFTFHGRDSASAVDEDAPTAIAQLGSSSPEDRDAAARILRSTFVPTDRKRWEPLLSAIKVGDTKKAVLERLGPTRGQAGNGHGTGQAHSVEYRLDDCWVLRCWYQNTDDTILQTELIESMRRIWVAPGGKFSGVWTTYFVNGQKSHEIHYKDGKYLGKFTSFHSNGSQCVVQHYGPTGVDGEDTGYFPSGRLAYRAYYQNGSPVGTWTWYNEDGSVRETRQHAAQ